LTLPPSPEIRKLSKATILESFQGSYQRRRISNILYLMLTLVKDHKQGRSVSRRLVSNRMLMILLGAKLTIIALDPLSILSKSLCESLRPTKKDGKVVF
jgi:hypothetical protein